MSLSNINIPSNGSIIPVDTRTTNLKVLLLPTVSTNSGRLITFKDYYGTSSNSSFYISTTGTDLLDDLGTRYTFSNAFGSISFLSDGVRSWRTIGFYDGALTPTVQDDIPLNPDARWSFLSTNYSGGGTVNNVGSNTSVGSATVVANSYTSASPGYITVANQVSQYVLAPSQASVQTIIMIVRVTNSGGNTYLLDARPNLGTGYMWSGSTGPDWLSATYYRDCVATAVPSNIPGSLQDSTWHHVCFIRSAFTNATTYLARFSLNESLGCDCAEIMAFTQSLSLQQVKDNFNFFASRFGWTPVP
jgi:hypothetical protein